MGIKRTEQLEKDFLEMNEMVNEEGTEKEKHAYQPSLGVIKHLIQVCYRLDRIYDKLKEEEREEGFL